MKKLTAPKNEFGVDLVKIWAMFSVVSVHFFLYSGYYTFKMEGWDALIYTTIRMLFYQCVPLFLMITGYLKRNTKFEPQHYVKVVPVLVTYLVCALIVIAYKVLYLKQHFVLITWLQTLWAFTQPSYAWYLNVYLSLFLIMPFISSAYNSLKTNKQKTAAVIIVVFVTMFASPINKIPINGEFIQRVGFVPNQFGGMWALGYYVVGMYISDVRPKIRKWLGVPLLVLLLGLEAYIDYLTASDNFYSGLNFTNEDCFNVPAAMLIFLLL